MKIDDKSYVAIDYALSLDSGEEVDRSEPGEPLEFIFNTGQVIPGLEAELKGMEKGQSTKFKVESENGYGQPRSELLRKIPRKEFPPDVKAGMAFQADGPHGQTPFLVREVNDEVVTIDLNHPLHKILEVREATEDELSVAADEAGCGQACCAGCGEEH